MVTHDGFVGQPPEMEVICKDAGCERSDTERRDQTPPRPHRPEKTVVRGCAEQIGGDAGNGRLRPRAGRETALQSLEDKPPRLILGNSVAARFILLPVNFP